MTLEQKCTQCDKLCDGFLCDECDNAQWERYNEGDDDASNDA